MLIIIVGVFFLVACTYELKTTDEPIADTPTTTKISFTPTPQETNTPELVIQPTRAPFRPDYSIDSNYTDEQKKLIESGRFVEQENELINMAVNFWSRANNIPFTDPLNTLKFKYLFDYLNPENAIVVISDSISPGYVFYFNIDKNGGFQKAPLDRPNGFTLKPHELPFQMSEVLNEGNVDSIGVTKQLFKTILINYGGNLVRINEKREIVGELNMVTGVWTKISTKPLITLDKDIYANREGLTTIEELKNNINDFLDNGAIVWNVDGPNKAELFYDYSYKKRIPNGWHECSYLEEPGFSYCKVAGIYLGSLIMPDNYANQVIISFLGVQNQINGKLAVEVFSHAFASEPNFFVPKKYMPTSIKNEKNPSWTELESEFSEGSDILLYLSHNLNQPIRVTFAINKTDEVILSLIDIFEENEKEYTKWMFDKMQNNDGIIEWLKNPNGEKVNGMLFSIDELGEILKLKVEDLPRTSSFGLYVPKE